MLVIFDLDGTLVDTYSIIRKTFIEVFANKLPLFLYDEKVIQSFFGPTLRETFSKLANNDVEFTEELIDEYRRINKGYYEAEIVVFDEVINVLEKLVKDHTLVVLTNRTKESALIGLEKTKIINYFDTVYGVEDLGRPKPHPDGLLKLMELYNKEADEVVYIGDAPTDVIAAKRAGAHAIATTWSINKEIDFKDVNPDYIINKVEKIFEVLEAINV